MTGNRSTTVLALVEHLDGAATDTSLETLVLARELAAAGAWPLEAGLIGPGAGAAAATLGAWGVDRAWVVEDETLGAYAPAAWGRCLAGLVTSAGARLVTGPGTGRGQEILAAAAAHVDAPLAAGCVDIKPAASGESAPAGAHRGAAAWAVTRLRWGGSVLEDAVLAGEPAFVSIAEHAVPIPETRPEPGPPPVVQRVTPADLGVGAEDLRVRLVHHEPARPGSIALADARVVVGGGRGVGGPEAFAQLEELATQLGGTIGVSRVVTSAGWRPHSEQVGQTGTRIAPDLYIACGISGAIQHIVGCRSAKAILAINTDPEAPIMSRATHAVIGDLHTVVPAIIAELRRAADG